MTRDLWRRFVELAETDSYGHMDAVMYGLGDLGLRALPLLDAAQARACA